jgi:type IV pilus assembly protein PilF
MRPEALLAMLLCLAVAGSAGAWEKAPKAPKVRKGPELSEAGRSNVMLAQAYLDAGRVDAAEERARSALATDGDVAIAHATMALVKARQKQDGKAEDEFKRALAIAPDDGNVLNVYASWLCARGDRAGADAAFQKALQDAAVSALQPLINAGQCAMSGRDWSKADGYLRRALSIAPQRRSLLLLLAETQLQLGRAMEARAFVQRADALGPDAGTLAMAVRAEEAAGDAAASARYRKRLYEQFPNYQPTGEGARKQ